MDNSFLLDKILNMERWQKLQDMLALITEMAIITVDYKGKPVTKHSSRREYCDYVRNDPSLCKLCEKCDSHGAHEAIRLSNPYVYKCHCNIIDIAIPIIVDNQHIGAIMAGEVRLYETDIDENLKKICSEDSTENLLKSPDLSCAYDKIPYISWEKMKISIQMLFELCNYLVTEAIQKNIILDMYEKAANNGIGSDVRSTASSSIKKLREDLSSILTSSYIKSHSEGDLLCSNKALWPAFNYIFSNKKSMLSQKDAARLCHMSSGHFSRLFLKETKENYSAFYNCLKIEWAKELLQETDFTIAHISEELGFNEPGYFTKIFRKYVGLSPSLYRKATQEESFTDRRQENPSR